MKTLLVARHARAEPSRGDDELRALVPQGIAEAEVTGKGLARLGFLRPRIIASPLVRTRTTAEIIARALDTSVSLDRALACGALPETMLESATMTSAETVLLVGHMPDVAHLVSSLVRSGAPPSFDTAAVACVDFEGAVRMGAGTLRFYYSPAELSRV